jgi:hypothetical protein
MLTETGENGLFRPSTRQEALVGLKQRRPAETMPRVCKFKSSLNHDRPHRHVNPILSAEVMRNMINNGRNTETVLHPDVLPPCITTGPREQDRRTMRSAKEKGGTEAKGVLTASHRGLFKGGCSQP